jgi:hypothetical protein
MKRSVLALTLILVLLLSAGKWLVSLTEAIPPEIEYKSPPIITIHSPANNATFTVNTVPLRFTVTKPDNWLVHGGYEAQQILKSVNYQLDGKFSENIPVNSTLELPFDCSLNLANLTDGVHSLKVFAYASGWVIQMNGFYEYEVPINSSSEIIYFTVVGESSSPEPTPTPTGEPQQPEQDMTAGAVFAVTSIIVFLGLLVYFIKRG